MCPPWKDEPIRASDFNYPDFLAQSAVKSVIQHDLAVHKWMHQNHVSTVLFESSKLANINHPCEYKKLLGCDTDF